MMQFQHNASWRYKMKKIIGLFVLLLIGNLAANSAIASGWKKYRVTITNATANHVITPPLIVIHNHKFKLFEVTGAASEGLAIQAETGSPVAIADEVITAEGVHKVITGNGGIGPGGKASFYFSASKKSLISVTGMLATTNDAFTSITSKALPKRSVSYKGETYDAGSESNNENCDYIPGPPCNNGTNISDDGEGFITIHNGVSGVGELVPADLDWRGATSIVTITRVDD